MPELRILDRNGRVIDPESPWRVTQRNGRLPLYGYTMSARDWQALLTRAKLGNPEAEWEVADRYGEGCRNSDGRVLVRRSPAKAIQWLRRAAEDGSTAAQNNLGVLLSRAEGTKREISEAISWFTRAFRAGDSCAALNLAVTYRQIGKLKAAVKWFRRAAATGDGEALIQLGIHYYWEKGIRKNPKAAVECFRKASRTTDISDCGRNDAFFLLGMAYLEGKGVRASTSKAKQLFKRANVDNDHPAARQMLSRV